MVNDIRLESFKRGFVIKAIPLLTEINTICKHGYVSFPVGKILKKHGLQYDIIKSIISVGILGSIGEKNKMLFHWKQHNIINEQLAEKIYNNYINLLRDKRIKKNEKLSLKNNSLVRIIGTKRPAYPTNIIPDIKIPTNIIPEPIIYKTNPEPKIQTKMENIKIESNDIKDILASLYVLRNKQQQELDITSKKIIEGENAINFILSFSKQVVVNLNNEETKTRCRKSKKFSPYTKKELIYFLSKPQSIIDILKQFYPDGINYDSNSSERSRVYSALYTLKKKGKVEKNSDNKFTLTEKHKLELGFIENLHKIS